MNFATFNELKFSFIKTKEDKLTQGHSSSDYSNIIEGIKIDTLTTLDLIEEKDIDRVCDCLINARRIFCIGTGSSSQVASDFNRKLKLIDLWSNDYLDKFSIERIPQIVTEQDLIIVFSLSGQVKDINEVMIRSKHSGASVIAVTGISSNQLKSISDYSLQVYNSPSNRKKLQSRLMLYVVSTLIYEKLIMKISKNT